MPFRLILLTLFYVLIVSCRESDRNAEDVSIDEISQVFPTEIDSFNSIDSLYFLHLGYMSLVTTKDDIVIADRRLRAILLITSELAVKKPVRGGRGPGEVEDAHRLTKDEKGNIYAYDQRNKKVIVFDHELNLIKEIYPKPFEGAAVVAVYPMTDDSYFFELTTFGFLQDKEKIREKVFVQYNSTTEEYGKKLVLADRPAALSYTDERVGGWSLVPFSYTQLIAHNPQNSSMLSFDTRTSQIAELDYNFDTLKVIPVNLPTELLDDAEIEDIKKHAKRDKGVERWKTIEPQLPRYKTVAEKMFFNKNQIWLQSNLRGSSQRWFVLNMDGQIIKIVHLPKDGTVTHVSDKHLGIRLDDSTFSLYTPVSN